MSNELKLSRRGFISRLSLTAGGILVAGSAADLLAGCGGGGLSGASLGETLPSIPAAIPKTPSQGIVGFAGATGIPVTFVKTTITGTVTSANLQASVSAMEAPNQLILVNGVLTTVGAAGVTPAEISAFENALISTGIVQPGDQTALITVNTPLGQEQVQAILDPAGNIVFCPFLSAAPPTVSVAAVHQGLNSQAQAILINPATGDVSVITASTTANSSSLAAATGAATPGTESAHGININQIIFEIQSKLRVFYTLQRFEQSRTVTSTEYHLIEEIQTIFNFYLSDPHLKAYQKNILLTLEGLVPTGS